MLANHAAQFLNTQQDETCHNPDLTTGAMVKHFNEDFFK